MYHSRKNEKNMDGNYDEDHRWDIAYYRSHDVLEPANPILFGKLMTRAFQNTIGLHGHGHYVTRNQVMYQRYEKIGKNRIAELEPERAR